MQKTKNKAVDSTNAKLVDLLDAAPVADCFVARAIGVAPSTLSAWKRGMTPPPGDAVERVTRAIAMLTTTNPATAA